MLLLRRIHLILGLVTIVAFALTGQYMDRFHDHLQGMAPTPRMLFRSAHIYLLFSGLLNCALGIAQAPGAIFWRRALATVGSLLLLATPALFLIAFFREPWLEELIRPYSRPAIYISLAGLLLHLAARVTLATRQAKGKATAASA